MPVLADENAINALILALQPYLSGSGGGTRDVLPFVDARAIASSSVSNSSLNASKVLVYFNTTTGRFVCADGSVLLVSPVYYANWTGGDAYDDGTGARAPKEGTLYVDTYGRLYVGHGGALKEVRAPWVFSSYSSGTACPEGFVTEAKEGDIVLLGSGTTRRTGVVTYRSASYIYVSAYDLSGLYRYTISISTAKVSSYSSSLFGSYATTSTVNALTTRVTTLETSLGDIDTALTAITG